MKRTILIIAGVLLYFPFTVSAAPADQTVKDIDENTENIAILQEQISLLEQQFKSQLKVSGYADVEYRSSSKPGDEPGFRLHHFSLFFKKKINEQWRFFSEIEYEDAPLIEFPENPPTDPANCSDCSGKIFVEAMNIDYLWKSQASLRFGRFFTPAGIWSIDHYPPFVPTQERPLHIRKIFPQLVDGAALFGRMSFGSSFLTYDFYTGNGEGNPGHGDINSDKASGLKFSLNFPLMDHTEIGATYYQDTLNDDTDKTVTGIHTKLEGGDFTFQAEYADGEYTPVTGQKYNSEGYYGQLYYRISNWLFGFRHDVFDKNSTALVGSVTRQSVFINYRVDKDIVFKLEYHETEPEDSAVPSTDLTIASIAIYLGD